MTKTTRWILISFLLVVALAGCGNKKVRPVVHEENSDEVTELEFFSSKRENVSSLSTLVDKFNVENPDIKVILDTPADAEIIIKTRMNKDDLPDIIAYGGDNIYTELTAAGSLVDLQDEPYVAKQQSSYQEIVYDISAGGKLGLYGIPFATNASGIIYNKDIFKQHGISIPSTWTELMEVCGRLQEAGVTPFELTYKDGWAILPSWNSLAPSIQPEGFIKARKVGEMTFLETHREVLEKYSQIASYGAEDFMNVTYDEGNKRFANGSAAMLINGSWAVSEIKKANPEVDLDMFAYPGTDDISRNKVVSGVDVLLCITTQCKNQEAAKRFIAFLMEPANNSQYINEQFSFSPIAGVVQNNPSVAGLLTDIEQGKVTDFADHYYPSGLDVSAILSEFLLNRENNMDEEINIINTLQKLDEQYDLFNQQ